MFNLDSVVRIQRGSLIGATGSVYARCNDGTCYISLHGGGQVWIHVTNLKDITNEDS